MIDNLAFSVLSAARQGRIIVLIDGGSGAGKTTLAAALVERLRHEVQPLHLVSLDEIYPGWHGLAAASQAVVRDILHPTAPGYRRWDWTNDRPAEWVSLSLDAHLVIEGCGAITPASNALSTTSIWCELDAAERRRRALARDGERYRPWWDVWAAQETKHWIAHRPWELADVIVNVH